jgi:enolase-like protein
VTAIRTVAARQILDSRGEPTIEVDVVLESGARGRSSAPSGASKGEYEAVELRVGDGPFGGRGVLHAIQHVEGKFAAALTGSTPPTSRRLTSCWSSWTARRQLARLRGYGEPESAGGGDPRAGDGEAVRPRRPARA